MLDRFLGMTFYVELAVAGAIAVAIWAIVRMTWGTRSEVKIHVSYLREPANTTVTLCGLLVPALAAVAGYLYVNHPVARFPSLVAALVVTLLAMLCALYMHFAVLTLADGAGSETVTIKPVHHHFLVIRGLMYGWLGLAFLYASLGLINEIPEKPQTASQPDSSQDTLADLDARTHYLAKPKARINERRADLLRLWGAPSGVETATKELRFDAPKSVIHVRFDSTGRLERVTETRRRE